MCELLGFSSNLPANVNLSLMQIARHGGYSSPSHDGWGVVYYEGADVRLIKEAGAAANSDWIRFLSDHSLRSPLVVAHIQHATIGSQTYANTQPFIRELGGRMHVFAHNGNLTGIFQAADFQPVRFQPVGQTDSEWAFCSLMDRIADCWRRPGVIPLLEERFGIVRSFARELRAFGPANFLYADGDVLFAHGHRRKNAGSGRIKAPGLVHLARWCRGDQHGFVTKGLSIESADQLISLVASVPLTADPWEPLAEGEVLAIAKGQVIALEMLNA